MPKKSNSTYCVYILICSDNTFYTGIALNLNERLKIHNSGKGAKYTRGRRPVRVCYFENGYSKSSALTREHEIKKLNRAQKILLMKRSSKSRKN